MASNGADAHHPVKPSGHPGDLAGHTGQMRKWRLRDITPPSCSWAFQSRAPFTTLAPPWASSPLAEHARLSAAPSPSPRICQAPLEPDHLLFADGQWSHTGSGVAKMAPGDRVPHLRGAAGPQPISANQEDSPVMMQACCWTQGWEDKAPS